MTLTAPEHLHGDLNNRARRHLIPARNSWLIAVANEGHSMVAAAAALGVSHWVAQRGLASTGYRRVSRQKAAGLAAQGIKTGRAGPVIDAMPHRARAVLADAAFRSKKPMAAVLADFWAQHHGSPA